MNDIECYLCGRSCGGSVSIRGGRQVCKECADKIDQKKPVMEAHPDFYYGYHGAYLFYDPIPVDMFCDMLENDIYSEFFCDVLIVKIKYKYDHEKEWTISNEILEPNFGHSIGDVWSWLNDWDEGQQQKYVIGWIPLSDVDFD